MDCLAWPFCRPDGLVLSGLSVVFVSQFPAKQKKQRLG